MANSLPCLIINSDDFGRDEITNRAILESFTGGLCSSTTIMANMPGFESAIQIAHENRLEGRIGLHINLSEGTPLTDPIRYCERFCNRDGDFIWPQSIKLFLSSSEKSAVRAEIQAQFDRCVHHQIFPTHFDSHRHSHTELGVFFVVVDMARSADVKYIRKAYTALRRTETSILKKIYRKGLNLLLCREFINSEHYGSLFEIDRLLRKQSVVSSEISIHPFYSPEGILIDRGGGDEKMSLSDLTKRLPEFRQISLQDFLNSERGR